jgi:hypothetical protein
VFGVCSDWHIQDLGCTAPSVDWRHGGASCAQPQFREDGGMVDPDGRLRSQYYTTKQLVALGRIVELSASVELLLRQVLETVMGISSDAGEAMFLGERASSLIKKFSALSLFQGIPTWFSEEAVGWARRVGKAIEKRDALVHRPPVFAYSGDIEDGDAGRLAWNRSRRSQKVEDFDETVLLELVDELAELEHEAANKLIWGEWAGAVGKSDEDDSQNT